MLDKVIVRSDSSTGHLFLSAKLFKVRGYLKIVYIPEIKADVIDHVNTFIFVWTCCQPSMGFYTQLWHTLPHTAENIYDLTQIPIIPWSMFSKSQTKWQWFISIFQSGETFHLEHLHYAQLTGKIYMEEQQSKHQNIIKANFRIEWCQKI